MSNDGGDETYVFLSDPWLAAVRRLRAEYEPDELTAPVKVTVNLVVTEVPFTDDNVHAFVDTSDGGIVIEVGHLDRADLDVTVDWVTAKALLIDGNPQAAMGAFMEGKVRIEGDVAKLMSFQSGMIDPSTQEAAARIRQLTA